MDVYLDGTTKFNPEYLAYLRTLTVEGKKLKDGSYLRVSWNPVGKVVRVETWTAAPEHVYENWFTKHWGK